MKSEAMSAGQGPGCNRVLFTHVRHGTAPQIKTTGACFMRESDRRRGICDKKMYFNKTNKCEANMSQRESHEGALTAQ